MYLSVFSLRNGLASNAFVRTNTGILSGKSLKPFSLHSVERFRTILKKRIICSFNLVICYSNLVIFAQMTKLS